MRRRRTVSPKPKRTSYELIDPNSVQGAPIYRLLTEIITATHDELASAQIALAWCTSWVPDADGHVTIGKCKRASDLDRELAAFDFIILLRRSFWLDDRVTDAQRRALLDHELCHAGVRLDAHGDPAKDDRGRTIYRTRKHDIEEFTGIVARHGCYKADLEAFAKALITRGVPEFTPCNLCQAMPGWVEVTVGGVKRVTRCECFVQWQQQKALGKSA
jgi:Putative phage metallopeptidase